MDRRKKIVIIFVIILTFLTFSSCKRQEEVDRKEQTSKVMKTGLLIDEIGQKDGAINNAAYKGLKEAEIDTGTLIDLYESKSKDDYKKGLDILVDGGAKLIWGAGYSSWEALWDASLEYPEVHFISLDNVFDKDSMPVNLTGTILKTEEASYILGYIAGMTTKTKKVGFLGGVEGVLVHKNEYGFRTGIFDAARDREYKIEVQTSYIDTFVDKGKGKVASQKLFENGIDIIYHDAGMGAIGAIEAAKEAEGLFIGQDSEQAKMAGKNALTAMLKEHDHIVNEFTSRFIGQEEMGAKNYELGLKGNYLGVMAPDENIALSKEVYDKAMSKAKEIIEGKIIPPFNEDTFYNYINEKK